MNQQRPRATDRPTVAEDEPSGLAITAETEPPSSPAAGRAAWSNRIIGHGEAEPDRLLANPANWRVHPAAQQDALAGVLSKVGWVQDIVVNRTTGHIIDGHLRVSLAVRRAEPSVPVVYVDLELAEEALILATFDPLSAMATTDADTLTSLLAGITLPDDLEFEGLAALLATLGPEAPPTGLADPDAVPEPAADPYVRTGELWALGDHRLLCGDATSATDVARVLGGERPRITVTDQPYGVSYDPSWRARLAPGAKYREGKVANDDRADWSAALALVPSDVVYLWHGGLHAGVAAASLEQAGFVIRSQIIWAKPSLVLSRGAYHWQHEPAFYAVREGATAQWLGDRQQTTLWEIPSVHRTAGTSDDAITDHGTQKPVQCMLRPLRNHEGDVFDPFVGSGTTLIAAEQLGRRCFAIDISPVYVQMAIERWQAFTGRTAELLT